MKVGLGRFRVKGVWRAWVEMEKDREKGVKLNKRKEMELGGSEEPGDRRGREEG